jgi:predicted SprT family Zn-dependent metalloprotease
LGEGKFKWTFEWSRGKRVFGLCVYGPSVHTIRLSKYLTELNDVNRVTNTILHEIAHALDVEIRGYSSHDYKWEKIALSIGCDGKRYVDVSEVTLPKSKYSLVCPNDDCKRETPRWKKPKNRVACGHCCSTHNKGKFTDKFLMFIKENY